MHTEFSCLQATVCRLAFVCVHGFETLNTRFYSFRYDPSTISIKSAIEDYCCSNGSHPLIDHGLYIFSKSIAIDGKRIKCADAAYVELTSDLEAKKPTFFSLKWRHYLMSYT